ncbi:MAG: hypothetical protein ACRDY6_14450 [Acidimicrobiia bacterium]
MNHAVRFLGELDFLKRVDEYLDWFARHESIFHGSDGTDTL